MSAVTYSTMNTIKYVCHPPLPLPPLPPPPLPSFLPPPPGCCFSFLLPGNNEWQLQLSVMNPIAANTCAQAPAIHCIDQSPLFQYFRQKARRRWREGGVGEGGGGRHSCFYRELNGGAENTESSVDSLSWSCRSFKSPAVRAMGQCKGKYQGADYCS